MKIAFAEKIFDVEENKAFPHEIEEGNFILLQNEVLLVETIQRDCEDWDSNSRFTMFTLRSREGKVIPKRDLFGAQIVYTKKWRKLYV